MVVRAWGEKPRFGFAPREHDEIGEKLGMLDFARAGKVSGARFVFYRGDLARLERALVDFFIDLHRERGYVELIPPYLVNAESMRGTGQLPNSSAAGMSRAMVTRENWDSSRPRSPATAAPTYTPTTQPRYSIVL